MKKTLALLTAVIFAATSASAATLGQWAEQASNKINQKEAAVTKKITDKESAYKKQQEQYKKEQAAKQAEQKAKQNAAKKKIETKKQQWKQLISE